MNTGKHTQFILTPIFEILKDCENAVKGISSSLVTYPLCDYIMQTTFLKMTGASEQKLKCILWEIATNDFDFRYEYLKPQTSYGECSRLEDKNKVFKALKDQIRIMNSDEDCFKNIFSNSVKNGFLISSVNEIENLFQHSVLSEWQGKQFVIFKKKAINLIKDHYCNFPNSKIPDVSLIESVIDYDKIVYRNRNRCAHNLKSYQVNLPSLSVLVKEDYDYENYFFRFSILVLLDEIFMKLYSEYLNYVKKSI